MRVTLLSSALISALGVSYQAQAYNCQSLATWNSSEIYTSGSQVQKENQAFEAAYWTQGNDPVTNSGPWEAWKSLGQCDNGGGNLPPSITFSSPTNNAEIPEGASITLLANASDEDGQVSQVEFLAGTQLIAVVTQAPFETPWTAVKGTSQLTAIATDNEGAIQSTNVNISVLPQGELAPPTISLTSPTGSETLSDKDSLIVSAQAADSDGIVTQVEFFVDNQSVFVDTNAPYEYLWNAVAGTHTFKAQATDDANLTTMSQNVSLVVSGSLNQKYRCDVAGWCSSDAAWAYEPGVGQYWQDAWSGLGACSTPPQITITSPNDGAVVLAGSNLTLSADASDADGSVTQVEFFANNSSLGVVTQPPYVQTWSATFVGANQLKAIATDNDNNVSESLVNVTVSDQALVVTLTSPKPTIALRTLSLGHLRRSVTLPSVLKRST